MTVFVLATDRCSCYIPPCGSLSGRIPCACTVTVVAAVGGCPGRRWEAASEQGCMRALTDQHGPPASCLIICMAWHGIASHCADELSAQIYVFLSVPSSPWLVLELFT